MHMYKKFVLFLSLFLSVVLVGQSCQVASAKGERLTLKLRTNKIDASIVDPSRNKLCVEDSDITGSTVVIQPAPKTLKDAKAVKIEGTSTDDCSLEIDVAKLGPVNLLPRGTYILTATKGKKKVKSKFTLNPPTLIIGRLQVPLPDNDGSKLARIRRYQTTGEPLPESDNLPDAQCSVFDENHELIGGSVTTTIKGEPDIIDNRTYYIYNIVNEVLGGTDLNHVFIKTEFEAPTTAGETEKIVYNAVAFQDNTNKKNNVNDIKTIDAASNAAAGVVTAISTEAKNIAQDEPISPKSTYEATTEACKEAVTNASDIKEAGSTVEAALQVYSTKIYEGAAQDLSNLKDIPQEVIGEIATSIASKAPAISKEAPEKFLDKDKLDAIPESTYAVGYLNPQVLEEEGFPLPPDGAVLDLLTKTNAVLGQFEVPSGDEIKNAFSQLTIPTPKVAVSKALGTLSELKTKFDQGDFGSKNFDPAVFNKLPVQPGATLDLGEISSDDVSGDFSIEALPGSIISGKASDLGGNINLRSHGGAFISNEITRSENFQSVSNTDTKTQYPPGFSPPVVEGGQVIPAFMPPAFAQKLTSGNFGISGGEAGKTFEIKGNVLALPTGGSSEQTSSLASSGIEVFDSAKHSNIISNAASTLGNNFSNVFSSVAVQLTNAFAQAPPTTQGGISGATSQSSVPTALSGLTNNQFNFGSFEAHEAVNVGPINISTFTTPASNPFASGKGGSKGTGPHGPGNNTTGGSVGSGVTEGGFSDGSANGGSSPPANFPGGTPGGEFPGTGFGVGGVPGETAGTYPVGGGPLSGPGGTGTGTQPIGTQPIGTHPAETHPAETQPTGTQPIGTQPIGTHPAETHPAETQPIGTQPTGTTPTTTNSGSYTPPPSGGGSYSPPPSGGGSYSPPPM